MYMKQQFSSLGHVITEGQWPLKDGEQTVQAVCAPAHCLGRASRRALVQREETQTELSSVPELRTYNGVWRDQVSRILQSKCQRGDCSTEKSRGLE